MQTGNLYSDAMVPTMDIVIPVLNESKTLETQITRLEEFLDKSNELKFDYRLTIADNGSTDSTSGIAQLLAIRFENARAISVGELVLRPL